MLLLCATNLALGLVLGPDSHCSVDVATYCVGKDSWVGEAFSSPLCE